MYDPAFPIAYYYSWQSVSDAMIPNVMAEFRENGAENLVMSHVWLDRMLRDMKFWSLLRRHARNQHVQLVEAHAPLGQGYDLCCPKRIISRNVEELGLPLAGVPFGAFSAAAACRQLDAGTAGKASDEELAQRSPWRDPIIDFYEGCSRIREQMKSIL